MNLPEPPRPLREELREDWDRFKLPLVCAFCACYVASCLLVLLGVLWTPVEQIASVTVGAWVFVRMVCNNEC